MGMGMGVEWKWAWGPFLGVMGIFYILMECELHRWMNLCEN